MSGAPNTLAPWAGYPDDRIMYGPRDFFCGPANPGVPGYAEITFPSVATAMMVFTSSGSEAYFGQGLRGDFKPDGSWDVNDVGIVKFDTTMKYNTAALVPLATSNLVIFNGNPFPLLIRVWAFLSSVPSRPRPATFKDDWALYSGALNDPD